MNLTHRTLDTWAPRVDTTDRRWAPFKASWTDTNELLRRELRHLEADNVIVATLHRPTHVRLDGQLRADAPEPGHPGVEISFDTPALGRLAYATDVCRRWRDNMRSIALGLEALRAVDRYGCSMRGEQYAGFRALPAGTGGTGAPDTLEAARQLLMRVTDVKASPGAVLDWQSMYREAVKQTHPDIGGDAAVFRHVEVAGRVLRSFGDIR